METAETAQGFTSSETIPRSIQTHIATIHIHTNTAEGEKQEGKAVGENLVKMLQEEKNPGFHGLKDVPSCFS